MDRETDRKLYNEVMTEYMTGNMQRFLNQFVYNDYAEGMELDWEQVKINGEFLKELRSAIDYILRENYYKKVIDESNQGLWYPRGADETEEQMEKRKKGIKIRVKCRVDWMKDKCTECENGKDCYGCGWCEEKVKIRTTAKGRIEIAKAVQEEKKKAYDTQSAKTVKPIEPEISMIEEMKRDNNMTQRAERASKPAKTNRLGNLVDKFLKVTYTVSSNDMRADRSNVKYLEEVLIENFMKLTKFEKMPCKGWAYVIENTNAGVPHLHGVVRLDVKDMKQAISAADKRLIGKNRMPGQKGEEGIRKEELKMLLKEKDVIGWYEYMGKEGKIREEGKIWKGINK